MRITNVQWHPYHIPFRTPFVTAHSPMAIRNGISVEIITEQGIVGVGDIAPLPGFGKDNLASAHSSLTMLAPLLHGRMVEDALELIGANPSPQKRGDILSRRGGALWPPVAQGLTDSPIQNDEGTTGGHKAPPPSQLHPRPYAIYEKPLLATEISPSTLCGLETALLDALGKTQHVSVAQLLAPTATHIRSRIVVNAVIGAKALETAISQAQNAVAAGFSCIKLKVGLHQDISQEIERIAAIREAIGPFCHLRLDANEAWSFEQAISVLSQCLRYDIQYVEQPLPADRLQDMHALRQAIPIPLAADEAVYSLESTLRVLAHKAADVLILKPQLIGGLRTARQIIRLAAEQGVQCVVTSSIESGVGVVAALHLVAASPEITLACGLATLDLLIDDLIVEDMPIQDGSLIVPAGFGLGIHLDKQTLF